MIFIVIMVVDFIFTNFFFLGLDSDALFRNFSILSTLWFMAGSIHPLWFFVNIFLFYFWTIMDDLCLNFCFFLKLLYYVPPPNPARRAKNYRDYWPKHSLPVGGDSYFYFFCYTFSLRLLTFRQEPIPLLFRRLLAGVWTRNGVP